MQWYNPDDLKKHLEHVYQEHRDRSKDDYIYNVVLDEIGRDGILSSNLDIILPYLPGGPKQAFDNVFVGSHFLAVAKDPYGYGMLNAEHRWKNLNQQLDLWKAFADKYDIPFHFYINHEGVLDYFDIPSIAHAYEAYLIQSCRDANSVRPGAAVLWCPAVWSRKALTKAETRGIKRTLQNVKIWSGTRGITWLHFQDMMGRKWSPSWWTVVKWYRQLKALGIFDSLRVDMELFQTTANGLAPADPGAVLARERYYKRYGVPVGASWELRWWYANHLEVE